TVHDQAQVQQICKVNTEIFEEHTATPPPQEKSYDSRDACMKSIQDWALKHGFGIVIKTLYMAKGNHWMIFVFDKSGKYWPHCPAKCCLSEVPAEAKEVSPPEAPGSMAKETASTSTKIVEDAKGTETTSTKIKKNLLTNDRHPETSMWDLTVFNPDHNHKLNNIIKLNAAGVPVLKIKNSLLKEGQLHAPLKTIQRERKKNNVETSAVEAMATSVKSRGFTHQIQSEISDKTGAHHLNA
ncbi:hypothetical protein PSTT_15886, partial [Puccinia striiformis]